MTLPSQMDIRRVVIYDENGKDIKELMNFIEERGQILIKVACQEGIVLLIIDKSNMHYEPIT